MWLFFKFPPKSIKPTALQHASLIMKINKQTWKTSNLFSAKSTKNYPMLSFYTVPKHTNLFSRVFDFVFVFVLFCFVLFCFVFVLFCFVFIFLITAMEVEIHKWKSFNSLCCARLCRTLSIPIANREFKCCSLCNKVSILRMFNFFAKKFSFIKNSLPN